MVSVTCIVKIVYRGGSYRHDDINEREIRVGKPLRDLDRLFQKLSAPSPINQWRSLVFSRDSRMTLAGCQCFRECPQENGRSGMSHDGGTTEDEAPFVVVFVQCYDGWKALDRQEV